MTDLAPGSGFKSIYKPKVGGLRFADLLERVAAVNPEVRVRFTSPHPKDFPDEARWHTFEFGRLQSSELVGLYIGGDWG